MAELSVVGQRLPRVDARAKVTGAAQYVGDMSVPGMLVGKVLRSPYPHALIRHIDTSRARRLAGVKAVLTWEDTPKILWNSAGFPPSPGAVLLEDQYILADKARYVGDGVAAVAAVDEDTALEALSLIEVDYEPLPAVFDAEEAMQEGAPAIHSGGNVHGHLPIVIGDVEEGFKEADYIFEDRYVTPKAWQCSLEPCGAALAVPDAAGRLTIYTSTQMPHLVRGITAKALGMRPGDIRIIKPYVGGAFGSRLGVVNEPIAGLLARAAGRPVKLIYTREESFLATESRHPIVMYLKTGVKKDGTFTARQMKAVIDAGAYATHTPSFAGPTGGWFLAMYKTPHVRYDGYSVYTNTTQCGAYRGYGNPQAVFAVESQVDDIAAKLGLDPLAMRLKNHPCKGEVWAWSGWQIDACGLEEAIERGAASIGWREKRGRGREAGGKVRRGVGMAYMMHVSGARPMLHETAGAMVKLNEDGTANVVFPTSDCGQGSATALSQVVAEELGLKFEDVIITQWADTDVAPFDIGSHASRQMYSAGNAVRYAAADAKKTLLAQAAKMLEVTPEELDVRESRVFVKSDPERSLTVAEVSHKAHFGELGYQIIGVYSQEPPDNPPVYAAQFAEVEVDTETGVVRVLKMAAAHDVGTAVNPAAVEGQIEGALQQGLGYALTENYQYDRESGRPHNPNFTDYKVFTAQDMPETDAILVQAATPTGPFGAKSVGESGLVATAAAIANAVFDATGVRIKELPLTPEVVLAALDEQKANSQG